ncbi:MAG: 5'/3'-nucleotidase SurE [Gloeomargaritaceae cyanobacterium C42_A2020_066]|nr:5'/3'-nucleotidase SurE [Gloeomargaritaceae cyanobacterium C42_A2020_066]
MRLLVSNDDGVFAPGVRALANHLAAAGHQVTVVCPDRERSATGHGLTMHKPLRVDAVEGVFSPGVQAWACSGTPSDCVKLALGALLSDPPDLVISGINQGPNLGTDILYSGTVSAAMEGVMEGIPAVAFSLGSYTQPEFEAAGRFARDLVTYLDKHPLTEILLLNVNIPYLPSEQWQGVQLTRQGVRRYTDLFEKRIDPRGKTYYWLAGEALEDVPETVDAQLPSHLPTDVAAVRQGYISITPLKYNLTHVRGVDQLAAWPLFVNGGQGFLV